MDELEEPEFDIVGTQPNAQAAQRVEWEEVARLADDAFDVWSGQPELLWAKQAWKVLAKAGLTAYRNKVEHHPVLFRLLALSGIYSDFCDVAFDETSEIEHSYSFELDKLVGGNSGRVFRAGGSRGGGRVR